jgi:integrase
VKTPDYLTEEELERLLKTALNGRYGVRDALLISLAYHHCMRVSELIGLKLSDVQDGRIRVNRKKGSISNEQPLQSAVGKPWLDEKKLPTTSSTMPRSLPASLAARLEPTF